MRKMIIRLFFFSDQRCIFLSKKLKKMLLFDDFCSSKKIASKPVSFNFERWFCSVYSGCACFMNLTFQNAIVICPQGLPWSLLLSDHHYSWFFMQELCALHLILGDTCKRGHHFKLLYWARGQMIIKWFIKVLTWK